MPGRIYPVRLEEVKALSDELRIMILEMLEREPMGVLEIVDALRRRGIVKTPNAIRYHLAVLKDAGLVELVRVGRVMKYRARDKYYAYMGTSEVDETLDRLAEEVKGKVYEVIRELMERHGDEVRDIAVKLKPCEFCITRHFIEQVLFEVLKRATGKSLAEYSRHIVS